MMIANKESQEEGYLLGSPAKESQRYNNPPSDGENSPEIQGNRFFTGKIGRNAVETNDDKVTNSTEFEFNNMTVKGGSVLEAKFKNT